MKGPAFHLDYHDDDDDDDDDADYDYYYYYFYNQKNNEHRNQIFILHILLSQQRMVLPGTYELLAYNINVNLCSQ